MEVNGIGNVGLTQLKPTNGPSTAEVAKSFSNFLNEAMDEVNQAQFASEKLTNQFVAGTIEDVHQVTIASQKSSVLLQLTMQVRNKAIESYQEIMRMSL